MSQPDPRLNALAGVLQLSGEARRAEGLDGFAFVAVNRTRQILDYRTAILWRPGELGGLRVHAVSGVPLPDADAPMVRWLARAATALRERPAGAVTAAALPATLAGEWAQWVPPNALWLPLPDPAGGVSQGGLWLFRDAPFGEGEAMLAATLAESFGETLARHVTRRAGLRGMLPHPRRRTLLAAMAGLAVLALVPVRLSVLAPAEIRPRDPAVVAAPRDGVVAAFLAESNQQVAAGQPLVALDDTETRAQADVAAKALAVAEAEWRKSAQASFGDRDSAADMQVLQARTERARAEAAHAAGLLARSQVSAPRAGIFVTPDPADWIGRPVRTGERIAAVADPARVELVVWLPVADVVVAEPGAEIDMFLNTAPLAPLAARLRTLSYDAQATEEGVLAYRLAADLDPAETIPRLGLKGTAKLHGHRVPLIAWILRRPLATLRQMVGW